MDTFIKKTPILLIDDNVEHFNQVKEYFGDDKYDWEHFSDFNNIDRIINFKAVNQDNQIVIVDHHLKASKNGLEIIRDYLWPSDRTTFFVVFSKFGEKMDEMKVNEVGPHWTFVLKKFKDIKDTCNEELSEECLKQLKNVVDAFCDCCNPHLPTPHQNPHLLLEELQQFLRDNKDLNFEPRLNNILKNSIIRSSDIIRECADAATVFNRAGELAKNIAIGIYGSCGRLEARPDSDIEFSIFFKSGDDAPYKTKKLAVISWNRIMNFMRKNKWKFEGNELVDHKDPSVLSEGDFPDDLPNRYLPVISIDSLLKKDPQKEPHIRNRHLQILTELKPIFNPELIHDLKYRLISGSSHGNFLKISNVVEQIIFENMDSQFLADTVPSNLGTFDSYKKFCYRVLHLLSLRIGLIRIIIFEDTFLDTKEKCENFFNSLSSPGIHKVVRFATACKHDIKNPAPKDNDIQKLLRSLIEHYLDIIEHLWQYSKDPEQLKAQKRNEEKTEEKGYTNYLRIPAKRCLNDFINVFNKIGEMDSMQKINDLKWLLETDKIRRLSDNW